MIYGRPVAPVREIIKEAATLLSQVLFFSSHTYSLHEAKLFLGVSNHLIVYCDDMEGRYPPHHDTMPRHCTLKCSNLVIHSTYWHSLVPLNRYCLFQCDDWTKARMNSYYWLTVHELLWISFIELPCKQGFIKLNSNLNMVLQFKHTEKRNIGSTFVQWFIMAFTYIHIYIYIFPY